MLVFIVSCLLLKSALSFFFFALVAEEVGGIADAVDAGGEAAGGNVHPPPAETPGVAEVNIVKNRSGQTGKVDLFFSKEFTQFSNYSKQDQQ